jgi:putative AlgH/UPF0301 family transcriptional regulator
VKGKSRRERLLEYTGTEIVKLLQRGNIIVTTKDRCDEHIELMKKHPDIKEMLSHWHKSVMYVIEADESRDVVMAVNTTREIEQPPDAITERLPGYRSRVFNPRAIWDRKFQSLNLAQQPYVKAIKHYIGGPVQPGQPLASIVVSEDQLAVFRAESSSTFRNLNDQLNKLRGTKHGYYFGAMEDILRAAKLWHKLQSSSASEKVVESEIKVFWGYAAWNHTQMVAELAKRSWGLVRGEDYKPTDTWIAVADKACVARKTEYSQHE